MSVERTERDTIAEIIAKTLVRLDGYSPGTQTILIGNYLPAADALLGVFDITPRNKEEDELAVHVGEPISAETRASMARVTSTVFSGTEVLPVFDDDGEVTPRGTEALPDPRDAAFIAWIEDWKRPPLPPGGAAERECFRAGWDAGVRQRGTEALPDADRLREIALLWWGDKQAEPARAELRALADALDSAGVRQHRDTRAPTREEVAVVVAWFFAESDTPYDIVDEFVERGWLAVSDGVDPQETR